MTAAELKLKYPTYASLGKEVEQKDRVDGRVYIVTTNGSDKECGFITDTYSGNRNHNIDGTYWAHWYEIPSDLLPDNGITVEQRREVVEDVIELFNQHYNNPNMSFKERCEKYLNLFLPKKINEPIVIEAGTDEEQILQIAEILSKMNNK